MLRRVKSPDEPWLGGSLAGATEDGFSLERVRGAYSHTWLRSQIKSERYMNVRRFEAGFGK